MREISSAAITDQIEKAFLDCTCLIGQDVEDGIRAAVETERSPLGREVLNELLQNYAIARSENVPICQDTGMATVFATLGQDVHITGGAFEDAVNEGVRRAYRDGYLRCSVVKDPLYERVNTRDNTPAVIHVRIVPGEELHLLCIAKGFGSENMGRIFMLAPAAGEAGVLNAILTTVREAGPNPCPPVIVGVGIGGTMESAAEAAKLMTAMPLSHHNPDPRYAALEEKALSGINRLGIGPAGTGGSTTALAVHIQQLPTHIAGMPVAVNICCHAARHHEITL